MSSTSNSRLSTKSNRSSTSILKETFGILISLDNLSSTLNLDSEFNYKSDKQGDVMSDSRLSRMKSTKGIAFIMNS